LYNGKYRQQFEISLKKSIVIRWTLGGVPKPQRSHTRRIRIIEA
jgi:hypothetical protein